MVHYLTADEVLAMNEVILNQAGGTLISRGGLESAVSRPQNVANYQKADLITQAAFLFMGIALAHAFVEGNKRTALAAGTSFLAANGYQVITPGDELGHELYYMVRRKEAGEEPLQAFLDWLRLHTYPL